MLFKKMLRDMKEHKMQFLSIFLMAFLAVFVFTGVGGEYTGLQSSVDSYYNTTNLADAWLYGENFNNNILNEVKNISSTSATERQLIISGLADLNGDPQLTLHFIEKNEISKFYLLEGKSFDINDKEGIWLDKRFADARNLSIGDNISINCNGTSIEKTIKGLGYSPEYVYEESDNSITPDFSKNSYVYLSYKAFPSSNQYSSDSLNSSSNQYSSDIPYNTLLVKVANGTNIDTYENQLSKKINENYSSFIPQKNHISVLQFNSEIDQHKMMGNVFPVIFVIISLLTLLTTMERIVNKQRTQIGILKALGFKNKTIHLHYLSFGFWLVLLGSVLGLILGPNTLPYLFYPSMSSFYTMPHWGPGFDISFLIIVILMVLFAIFVSYFATRNIVNEDPASTIRPKAPKIANTGFLEKFKFWNKLSFNARWNYRDLKQNKMRGIMTVFGVLGCTALLICAFGMNDSMHDLKTWQYGTIDHYDSKLAIEDNATGSQIQSVVDDVHGDKIMESSVEIKANGIKKTGSLLSDNGTDLITPTDDNKNPIELSSGVSISKKMAKLLDVQKGDTIQWHILGTDKWVKTNISGIYSNPTSQGIMISANSLEDLDYNYTPTSIITNESVYKNYSGISGVNSISSIMDNWDEMTESMMLMVYVLISFASILSVVVLYNLGLLSFTEIERDMATLKVLGFKTKNLRKLLLTQNLWLSTIGFIIGVPLGTLLLKLILDSSGDSFYFPLNISITNILLSFVITFGLSIIVNLVFSNKIKNINMVESLKGTE